MDNPKTLRVFLITVVSGFAVVGLLLWFLQRSGQVETIVGTAPLPTNATEITAPPPQAMEQPAAPVSWHPPVSTQVATRPQQAQPQHAPAKAQTGLDNDVAAKLRQRKQAEERIDRQEILDAEAQLSYDKKHIINAVTRREITRAEADRLVDLKSQFQTKYGHLP